PMFAPRRSGSRSVRGASPRPRGNTTWSSRTRGSWPRWTRPRRSRDGAVMTDTARTDAGSSTRGTPLRALEDVRGIPRSPARSLWASYRETRDPATFLRSHVWPWLTHYVRVMFLPRLRLPRYAAPASERPGIFPLPESGQVALAGDWGTGTASAARVA